MASFSRSVDSLSLVPASSPHYDEDNNDLPEYQEYQEVETTSRNKMLEAIEQDNYEDFLVLLNGPETCKQELETGKTLLHWISQFNRSDPRYIRALLSHVLSSGFKHTDLYVNLKDTEGFSALHTSVINNCHQMIPVLLSWGLDIQSKGNNDQSCLMLAASNGSERSLELLLEFSNEYEKRDSTTSRAAGEDDHMYSINLVDNKGWSALHHAAASGSSKCIEILLKLKGIKTDLRDPYGNSPFFLACLNGHIDASKALFQIGKADIELRDNFGSSPLHIAVQSGKEEMVSYLVSIGCNANICDSSGMNALQKTIFCETEPRIISMTEILLNSRNTLIDLTDKEGVSLLSKASFLGLAGLVRLLVSRGAQLNKVDNYSLTPLHKAAANGQEEVVLLLIEAGAEVDLLSVQDNHSPLMKAVLGNHLSICKALLDCGADLECSDLSSRTSAFYAARDCFQEIMEVLIQRGARLDGADCEGDSPMHIATINGHCEIVRLLLESPHSFNLLNDQDLNGVSPLHIACRIGHLKLCKMLLKAGSTVNAIDNNGRTPLSCVNTENHPEVFKLIESAGGKLGKGGRKEKSKAFLSRIFQSSGNL